MQDIKSKKKKVKNIPKNSKFKRLHKGFISSIEYKKSIINLYYGVFGLKVLKRCRLSIKQLNAAKQKIIKAIKKKEKLWIRGFTDIPVTKKPNEMRMGKGKGSVEYWILRVKAGCSLFELSNMSKKRAFMLLSDAAKKLPSPTVFIYHKSKLFK
jgi:large subunit ribosomal protein L16